MGNSEKLQTDWEFNPGEGLPVSVLTAELKWNRLTGEFIQFIKKECGSKFSICDVGGGDGGLYELLKDICVFYVNMEPSTELVKKNKRTGNNYVCRAFGERLPCKSEMFDAVTIKAALDHCVDPYMVLSESFRVLKQGGKIFILLTNDGAWYKKLFKKYNRDRRKGCKDHNYYFNAEEIKKLLQNTGFIKLDMYDFDYLRLPILIENTVMYIVPNKILLHFMRGIDNVLGRILPGCGGSYICVASKKYI